MGKRGPGAKRLREAARAALDVQVSHPWEKDGMPPADRMLAFLGELPIVSGLKAGERMEVAGFQERFVRSVYAPLDDAGLRLVRLAALSVARGNGKSGLLAGLGLGHLLGPMCEPYGEVYAAALDREQAGVLYRMTKAYIEAVPWMAARVNIKDYNKSITDEETQSTWTALTSDARKAHGLAPSFWIADEVAQWKSRELWDNLATGMGKRAQALGVSISTQAADDHHFLSEMLDGEHDETVYVQLHAAPEGCDLDDREAWAAANPALGTFRDLKEFEIACDRAKRMPSFEPAFRLLYLNQRVDAEARFLTRADWEANHEAFDIADLEGERCWGGLDLASTRDLNAFCLWFPDHGRALWWHWTPADSIDERADRDRVPYRLWADQDFLALTPGNATDRRAIVRQLAEVRAMFDVQGIAYDRWRFEDLRKMLDEEGIELPLVPFVPGIKSYAAAMDAFERAVLERDMRHNPNPLLNWQAGGLVVETDSAGNRKPTKAKSTSRIDGLVCGIMAVGLAAAHPEAQPLEFGLAWL